MSECNSLADFGAVESGGCLPLVADEALAGVVAGVVGVDTAAAEPGVAGVRRSTLVLVALSGDENEKTSFPIGASRGFFGTRSD